MGPNIGSTMEKKTHVKERNHALVGSSSEVLKKLQKQTERPNNNLKFLPIFEVKEKSSRPLFSVTLALDRSLGGLAPTGRLVLAVPGANDMATSKRRLHATAARLKQTATANGHAKAWIDG